MPHSALRALPLIGMIVSTGSICLGAWLHTLDSAEASRLGWTPLSPVMAALRSGAPAAACEGVADGPPRVTCLLYAADVALHRGDVTALREVCGRLPAGTWRQSCSLDALGIDPALDLVAYIDACDRAVPLYRFHCVSHARNRLEGLPGELPLAPEARPAELVRIFPTLALDPDPAANEVAARAIGARLSASGQPISACDALDPTLQAPCRERFSRAGVRGQNDPAAPNAPREDP